MQGYVKDFEGNEIPISYGGEQFIHCDCMDLLKSMPDQSVDLALVDPPYGHILEQDFKRADGSRFGGRFDKYGRDVITRTGGSWSTKYQRDTSIKKWDVAPPKEYFDELFRVSKEQIVWGGNYFTQFLPPSRCFVIWHKLTISDKFSMAMAEYAWASFRENAKLISLTPQGKKDDERFHPTQKPVALYEFCLQQFAKHGQVVLDTHAGSGSSLIACHHFGCHYIGCEINEQYYKLAKARIEKDKSQGTLFDFTQEML